MVLFSDLIYHPYSSWNIAAPPCITSLPTALHFTRGKKKKKKKTTTTAADEKHRLAVILFSLSLTIRSLWDACWRVQEKEVRGSSHCCSCCVCNNYRVKKLWLPDFTGAGLEKIYKFPALRTKREVCVVLLTHFFQEWFPRMQCKCKRLTSQSESLHNYF